MDLCERVFARVQHTYPVLPLALPSLSQQWEFLAVECVGLMTGEKVRERGKEGVRAPVLALPRSKEGEEEGWETGKTVSREGGREGGRDGRRYVKCSHTY